MEDGERGIFATVRRPRRGKIPQGGAQPRTNVGAVLSIQGDMEAAL